MKIHKNARLTLLRRVEMAKAITEGSLSRRGACRLYGVSATTADKWVKRFIEEGEDGMGHRTSRPRSHPSQTAPSVEQEIRELREGNLRGAQIAEKLGVSPATVSRVLKRAGMSRPNYLQTKKPERR